MGCHFFLQGIFPTQGSNTHLLRLLHCRQTLLLSHQGSPRGNLVSSKGQEVGARRSTWWQVCRARHSQLQEAARLTGDDEREQAWTGRLSRQSPCNQQSLAEYSCGPRSGKQQCFCSLCILRSLSDHFDRLARCHRKIQPAHLWHSPCFLCNGRK